MQGAPAWVTYVTAGIALAAFAVSIQTYRRAGARIKVHMTLPRDWNSATAPDVTITITNGGLAPISIQKFRMGLQLGGSVLHVADLTNNDLYAGQNLPYRLDGQDAKEWVFSLEEALIRETKSARALPKKPDRLRGKIRAVLNFLIRPEMRNQFSLLRRLSLTPLALIPIGTIGLFGIVFWVDLGNGVQKPTTPSLRLAYWVYREILNRLSPKDPSPT
jgi:hypothetical protein